MQLPPPFSFDNVSIHAFPLRAKLRVLQRFCDEYVNIIPPEAGYFHPFMPYVFMFVVNYGRMAMKEASLGWLSQNEVVFGIPVEWYVLKEGQPVFHDWGLVTPFIYIDNPLSITTGRMVYGWPKSRGTLTPEVSTWMDRPQDLLRLLSFSVPINVDTSTTRKREDKVIFEIFCDPLGARVKSPLSLLRRAPSLARDLADILLELSLARNSPGTSLENWAARLQRFGRKLNPFDPKVQFSTINLKQFRSSYDARSACYQGVTAAAMELRGINQVGRLDRDTFGDPSGGFRIHMHRYQMYPIIESLGIEVDHEWKGPGADVALIKPTFPFWVDMDLKYHIGQTIAWRTTRSDWVGPGGRKYLNRTQAPGDVYKKLPPYNSISGSTREILGPAEKLPPYNSVSGRTRESSRPAEKLPPYNSVSGSTREILGPFEMPNTTLRVLPLLADKEKLQQHCDQYLNRPLLGKADHDGPLDELERSFDVWGSYVYLVIANHKSMVSETDNIGWWAHRDVTFYVPVKWYERQSGGRSLRSMALVPFYSYASSETAAITGAEVTGVPIMMADITSGASPWMDEAGPSEATTAEYVQVRTMMFQLFGEGVKAQNDVLLNVWNGLMCPYNDDVEWRRVASTWLDALVSEVERKNTCAKEHPDELLAARTLALQALNQRTMNIMTLKQFRDCAEPDAACYQSLNLIRRHIEHVYDMREIETRLYVSVYSHQSQPIVKTLGLVCATTHEDGAIVEYVLQPVRPFWVRVRMREENAVVVQYRAGDIDWKEGLEAPRDELECYFDEIDESKAAAGKHQSVRPFLQKLFKRLDPQQLSEQVSEILTSYSDEDRDEFMSRLKRAQRRAIEVIEPQMIIEPALSEEWENWGNPRWHREKQKEKYRPKGEGKPRPEDERKRRKEILDAARKPPFCIPAWTWETRDPRQKKWGFEDECWWHYEDGDPWFKGQPAKQAPQGPRTRARRQK